MHRPTRILLATAALIGAIVGCSPEGEDTATTSANSAAASTDAVINIEPMAGRNFVLITVDAMRADHLGIYGYTDAKTPNIDALANEGLRFTRAYANSSYTGQSLSAMISGRLPSSGGAIDLLEAEPQPPSKTLAEHFLASGYATAFMANQSLLRGRGFTKGFEDVLVSNAGDADTAADVTANALRFVEDVAAEKFFLHVHFAEPHEPYAEPDEDAVTLREIRENYAEFASDTARDEKLGTLVERYDAEIAAVDAAVGTLVNGLRDRGVFNQTFVVFTSTHGEEFWEHEYVGHAWTLNEEVLRVPLIFHAPGSVPPGVVNATTSLVDVFPTLLTLFDIKPQNEFGNAASLVAREGEQFSFSALPRSVLAELVIRNRCVVRTVIDNGWKYVAIQHTRSPADRLMAQDTPLPVWGTVVAEELYNLDNDPGERDNVIESNPPVLPGLREKLEQYRIQCEQHAIPAPELKDALELADPEEMESLESLGYL